MPWPTAKHHAAWLQAHPERTLEWLKARIADGFQIHHLDGNGQNDDPGNLVLIEWRDHVMVHSGKRPIRSILAPKPKRRPGRWVDLGDGREIMMRPGERARWARAAYKVGDPHVVGRAVPKSPTPG